MMKIIGNLPDEVLGIEAGGKITHDDYQKVLIPAAEEKIRRHDKIRMLFMLGDMDGFEFAALWDDTKFGLTHWKEFTRIAIVTDNVYIKSMTTLFAPFFPGEIRLYESLEKDDAILWIGEGLHQKVQKGVAA